MTRKYSPQNWLDWWLSKIKPRADNPVPMGDHLNMALRRRRFVRSKDN